MAVYKLRYYIQFQRTISTKDIESIKDKWYFLKLKKYILPKFQYRWVPLQLRGRIGALIKLNPYYRRRKTARRDLSQTCIRDGLCSLQADTLTYNLLVLSESLNVKYDRNVTVVGTWCQNIEFN